MDFIAFEFSYALWVLSQDDLVAFKLLGVFPFMDIFKSSDHEVKGFRDRPFQDFEGRTLPLDFFDKLEAKTSAMLEALKSLFQKWVIVKECLLKVLNGSEVQALNEARGSKYGLEIVSFFDIVINKTVIYGYGCWE